MSFLCHLYLPPFISYWIQSKVKVHTLPVKSLDTPSLLMVFLCFYYFLDCRHINCMKQDIWNYEELRKKKMIKKKTKKTLTLTF